MAESKVEPHDSLPPKRLIYIIGENYEHKYISKGKVALLPRDEDADKKTPFFVFTESSISTIYDSEGVRGSIDNHERLDPLPTHLEMGICLIKFLGFYKEIKKGGSPLEPVKMVVISTILTNAVTILEMPREEIIVMLDNEPSKLFYLCIREIMMCTDVLIANNDEYSKKIQEDSEEIQNLLGLSTGFDSKYTYDNSDKLPDFHENLDKAFKLSNGISNKCIVKAVLSKHLTSPMNMFFVIVLDYSHNLKNIKDILEKVSPDFEVYANDFEEFDTPDVFTSGGKRIKRTKRIKKLKRKKTRRNKRTKGQNKR